MARKEGRKGGRKTVKREIWEKDREGRSNGRGMIEENKGVGENK